MLKAATEIFAPFVVFAAASLTANAAQIEAVAPDKSSTTLIIVDGTLEKDDEKKFINIALPQPDAIMIFRSNGGNLVAGIEIDKAIRMKGFSTLVPNDMHCASACALAWLGGRVRAMSRSARIGFHAASVADKGEVTSVGNAMIGAYLNQLGLPTSAIVYITEPSPDEIRWLTFSDAQTYGIDGKPLEIEETPASRATQDTRPPPSRMPSSTSQQGRARDFVIDYFEKSGLPNDAALKQLTKFYTNNINYYNKIVPLEAVVSEKVKFFERWPIRKYVVDTSTLVINCSPTECLIGGEVAWRMHSPERKAISVGKAKISYTVIPGNGMLITSEWSKVISREVKSSEAPRPKKYGDDLIICAHNGPCTLSKIGVEPVRRSSPLFYAVSPSLGRSMYSIEVTRMNGTKMFISLSGGVDSQPPLSDYRLYLDKVQLKVGSKTNFF